jgi:aldose 1-epimerase
MSARTDRSPAPTGEQFDIVHGDQRATIVELGAALRAYEVGGRPRLDGYEHDEMCTGSRGQVLLPWPNRIAGGTYRFGGTDHPLAWNEPQKHNAIHGLVRWSRWNVDRAAADRVTLSHTLLPQPGYEFTVAFTLEYALGDDGLDVRVDATNLGAEPCPFGAGFHPYLRLDTERIDELELSSPASAYYLANADQIPTARAPVDDTELDFRAPRLIGSTRMDTAFTGLERGADGRATVTLRDPRSGDAVSMWCDERFDYLMVFTGDALPDPQRRRTGLAVEPMTCAPDAFRSGDGLLVLEPGETCTGRWGIVSQRFPPQRASGASGATSAGG